MVFSVLFLIPLLVGVTAFFVWNKRFHWIELIIQVTLTAIIAGTSCCIIKNQNVSDVETWNGVVTGKEREEVSCRHSYQCNCVSCMCTTDSKGYQSCSTCCQTCYDHSYDVDWNVNTTLGTYTIDTIDRQGLERPPRWSAAYVGEPVAQTHTYVNPIKGASDTLFRHDNRHRGKKVPPYPSVVYDYHHLNRLVSNKPVTDAVRWNALLEQTNSSLFGAKGNLIIFIAQSVGQEYTADIEAAWLGGKKNDVIVVLGTNDNVKIEWSHVISWTTHAELKVAIENHMKTATLSDFEGLLATIQGDIISKFEHRSMKDFEYLMSSVQPSMTQWIVALLINLIVAVAAATFFIHNDHIETSFEN